MKSIDLRGLKCPLPALFARRALANGVDGLQIAILTDDPMATLDVPHMCHREGFDVIAVERDGDNARMVLRRPTAWAPVAGPDAPEHPGP
ncbi:MAG TPA: sulfurtransferase TusA family protein [Rhizomicrobium sp.]|nr:sulfurtransferase TusA family protein [Rhizomicrobium sp.]